MATQWAMATLSMTILPKKSDFLSLSTYQMPVIPQTLLSPSLLYAGIFNWLHLVQVTTDAVRS